MVRVPTHREPTHPGEILREEFLEPMGLTQQELADAIHVPFQRVNEIVRGRRAMSTSTALRLSRYFGTSAGFWMNLQLRYDLYKTERSEREALEEIEPLHHVG
ncbi:MAG: HigA family addiction module antitoxin [Alkalispirochaeta sp.]